MVSLIALFAALCGGAYAAGKLGANSVGSKQVKPDSLDGRDIREAKLGEVPAAGNAGTLDGIDSAALARRGLSWDPVDEAHQASSPPGQFTCFHSDGVVCDEHFENFDGPGGQARRGLRARRIRHRPPAGIGPLPDLPGRHGQPRRDLRRFPPDSARPRSRCSRRSRTAPTVNSVRRQRRRRRDAGLGRFQDNDWFSLAGISFPAAP